MRKPDPKNVRLAEHPLLRSLHRHDIERLSSNFDEITLPAGRVLMRQGFTAGETFLIRTGQVVVTVDGTEVARLGPGEIVGETAVLARSQRNATVTAATTVQAFVVTPGVLSALIYERGVGARIAETVAIRSR